MAAAVPSTTPARAVAGDTLAWTTALSDYPASDGWSLAHSFRYQHGSGALDVSGVASGSDFLTTISAASSNLMKAGLWTWAAYVTLTTQRYRVGTGTLDLAPNLATIAFETDLRSSAKQAMDTWQAIWTGVTNAKSYTLNNRTWTSHDISEIIKGYELAKSEYQAELQAEQLAITGINPRRIGIRLIRV